MAVQWTEQQLQAIEARGSNILVAAAAGSGKTAVLVERIIRRICDKENPVPVDRLLVLTFTEAAASEMKRKIADAIQRRLQEEPENKRLREQSILIHSAHISTIHAFCKTILENHIHETDLPADFTLIDDVENQVLREQALDQVLERYYKRIEKKTAFRDLALGYGGIKTDDNLRGTVLRLHDFVRSLAYPENWLKETAEQYRIVCQTGSLSGTIWETLLLSLCRELVQEAFSGLEAIWRIVEAEVPSDHKYFDYYQDLLVQFQEAFALFLYASPTLKDLDYPLSTFTIPRAPVKKGLDDSLVARINGIKKEMVIQSLDEIRTLLHGAQPEQLQRIILCSPRIQTLKQLVRQTERLHRFLKRERSALDFSDLEHEMIKLISDRRGHPTKTAKKLQQQFEEILVDEYQDTNNIQDTMFRLLSRNEKNIFMVGDLKQSIYQFRNANPGIFAEKYRAYSKGEGGICIRLFRNFRSRDTVVETVNGIFAALMTRETGGLDYTQEEFLIQGAKYPENAGDFSTELLLTDTDRSHYSSSGLYSSCSANQLEAITVARRILRLVGGQEIQVTDGKTGTLRPIRLGDITILVRNKKKATELEQILELHGIPAISETGRSYLNSLEVLTVLSFLQIIDNPRQDIPLLAVLRSAIFNFSPDELAEIRLGTRGAFYDALCTAREDGNQRVTEFLSVLEALREDAEHAGVDQLIWKICYELQYMTLAGAMPGGEIRQANLKLLYERGAEFEQGALSGLFHFMAYIESLRAGGKDMTAAKTFTETENMVSVMTIHKSKGLEYPVVILYGTEQRFNEMDAVKPIIWSEQTGIAMDFVDTRRRIRYQSLPKALTRENILHSQHAEEMRLLYVALTRAKEKLILSATVGARANKWKEAVFSESGVLPGFTRRRLSMRDWILSALLPHPDATILRENAERFELLPNGKMSFGLHTQMVNHELDPIAVSEPLTAETAETPGRSPKTSEDLHGKLTFRYPHKGLCLTPAKMSVSELKRRRMPEEDFAPGILRLNQVFLSGTSEIKAAERGTITHYVMQHIDFSKTETQEQVNQQLETMVTNGLISNSQRNAVQAKQIFQFFQQPLGQRLRQAKRVEREFDFYMEIPAKEVTEGLSSRDGEEKVLLQGIADCFFYDDNGVVLIDYKTDGITQEAVPARAERYRTQMEYYARGLAEILGCPIQERYLYFLHCGQAAAL